MINSTKQRYVFAIDGAVAPANTSAEKLAKGQFMIGDVSKPGIQAVGDMTLIRKDQKRLKLMVGEDKRTRSRSFTHGASETKLFSLSQVQEIRVTLPKVLKPQVDEWVIGWNGREAEPETSLKFTNSSKPFRLYATLTGFPVNFNGNATEVIDFTYPIEGSAFFNPCTETDKCDPIPCQGIVEDIVKRLRNQRTSGGYKFGDYADITPVISCMDSTSTSTLTYYTLSVCDTGDARALSFVQGQYPNLVVKRLGRKGSTTTYQTLSATAPADFSRTNVEIVPTCSTCPAGWNTITGGYIYVVTVADGEMDLSSNIVPALTVSGVAPTVERIGSESGTYVGVYSVISPVTLNPTSSSLSSLPGFTIAYLGEKDTVCSDETTVTTAWVDGDSCDLAQDTYEITLMDTECGETRLEELQKAYPELSISIGASTQKSVFLFAGTSGDGNISIDGVNYAITFASNLITTITNFVTAHGATLAGLGITVTVAGSNKLSFVAPSTVNITYTQTTADLSATNVVSPIQDREACSTRYVAVVGTNMVCNECDEVFKDFFVSEAPQLYDDVQWKIVTKASDSGDSEDCLCGIRIKAKPYTLDVDTINMYKVPYIETSPTIEISAGFEDFVDLVGATQGFSAPSAKTRKSFKKDRDMLVGNLFGKLRHANMYNHGYSTGFNRMQDDFLGMSIPFDNPSAQVVQVSIDLSHDRYQQGFRSNDGVTETFNIFVEYGKEADIINEVNLLASAANKQVYYIQ